MAVVEVDVSEELLDIRGLATNVVVVSVFVSTLLCRLKRTGLVSYWGTKQGGGYTGKINTINQFSHSTHAPAPWCCKVYPMHLLKQYYSTDVEQRR